MSMSFQKSSIFLLNELLDAASTTDGRSCVLLHVFYRPAKVCQLHYVEIYHTVFVAELYTFSTLNITNLGNVGKNGIKRMQEAVVSNVDSKLLCNCLCITVDSVSNPIDQLHTEIEQ